MAILDRWALILVALSLAGAASAVTSCGGGCGYLPVIPPPMDPTYTPSSSAFSAFNPDAPPTSVLATPVLVVLQTRQHPLGIWDDELVELSKSMPFVRIDDDDAATFASRWTIDSLPAVALCDRLGNVLAAVTGRARATDIKFMITHAPEERAACDRALAQEVDRAESDVQANRIPQALDGLGRVGHYQGFAACRRAAAIMKALLHDGEQQVAMASARDRHEARGALESIARSYRGTTVADDAQRALKQLE